NAKFEILVAKDNSEFFTSDNPLVFQDGISTNEFPLMKSKEFVISLNKDVALRILHDNRLERNKIYRMYYPNGSVASLNNVILNQSSRFIIANKKAIEAYKHIYDTFLKNTSLEMKI